MKEKIISLFSTVSGLIVVIWFIFVINIMSEYSLNNWGIIPRTIQGLRGIIAGPFIHGDTLHIVLNTVPLAILGSLVALRGGKEFFRITIFILLVSGTAVWVFARPASHIGASGLIFGYFGYLIAKGWLDKKPVSVAAALLTIFLYGGLFWGIFPSNSSISFEGHLFGMIAGIVKARGEH